MDFYQCLARCLSLPVLRQAHGVQGMLWLRLLPSRPAQVGAPMQGRKANLPTGDAVNCADGAAPHPAGVLA
jgi:hypothetical protein